MKVAIAFPMAIQAYEGPAYEESTEDGPVARTSYFVGGRFADGVERTHIKAFRFRADAETLAYRVNMAGVAETEYWFEGSAWDGVRAEIEAANEWLAMGANEADLEAMGLA